MFCFGQSAHTPRVPGTYPLLVETGTNVISPKIKLEGIKKRTSFGVSL